MQLFQQQQQQAADREQRREERRDEQRREDRREAAEREARLEARLAEREARVEARLLQNPSIASVGYRIGSAAKEFRPFEGKEDGAAYILELTHLLGTHEVPATQWPRELSLKLKGSAANWYAARFPDLPVGTFPPWSEFYAAMLHTYSQSYGAAGAYQDLHNLRRLPGSTGKEAYARVEEHSMLLRRKGVHNPGPEEQHAYILQNQLTAGESARWISLANADEKISDAALNALELGTADARTGRLSCPPPTREAFFAARREHLRNFLNEQGPATTGDRSMGSSSARAAVSTGNDTTEPPPRLRRGHHPHRPRPPPRTGQPWWRASRPNTWHAGATRKNPLRGTTAHRNALTCPAMRKCLLSAGPPGRASAAPQRSSRLKDPFRIGGASTTGKTPPTPTGPVVWMARAQRRSTAVEGAGPGPASIHLPPPRPTWGRGGGGSGRRPA
jgi:hypothetical protein